MRPIRTLHLHNGFTLVELLIVVAIISVLISMLLPTVTKARDAANRLTCSSNLRQIGTGLLTYAGENHGWMPGGANQIWNYGEYVAPPASPKPFFASGQFAPNTYLTGALHLKMNTNAFHCPSIPAELSNITFVPSMTPTDTSDTSYMANSVVMCRKISQVRNATGIIMLREWIFRSNCCLQRPFPSNYPSGYVWGSRDASGPLVFTQWHVSAPDIYGERLDAVHARRSGGNFIFVDGHGEFIQFKNLRSSMFGLTPDEAYLTSNGTGSYLSAF